MTSDAWEAAEALGDGKHVRLESPRRGRDPPRPAPQPSGWKPRTPGSRRSCTTCARCRSRGPTCSARSRRGSPGSTCPSSAATPAPAAPPTAAQAEGRQGRHVRPVHRRPPRSGVGVADVRVDASHLKATQRELDGVKVAGMMTAMQGGKLRRPRRVLRHPRQLRGGWPSSVGGDGRRASSRRASRSPWTSSGSTCPSLDVLDRANTFTAAQGLPQPGIAGSPAARPVPGGHAMTSTADFAQRLYVQVANGQTQPGGSPRTRRRTGTAGRCHLDTFHLPVNTTRSATPGKARA